MAFSAILPLMTVVKLFGAGHHQPRAPRVCGHQMVRCRSCATELRCALLQITFSLAVLAVEIPLGILLALSMPAQGWKSSAVLVVVALSLLIPWNVVGTIWQIYGRADIGLMGRLLQEMGIDYSYTGNATQAWLTVLLMDVALDAAGGAAGVCRAALHSGRATTRLRASTVPASSRCSATSSCPRCAAC